MIKKRIMKTQLTYFVLAGAVLLHACSSGGDDLATKKAELEKLKKDQSSLTQKIEALQQEISKLDTAAQLQEKSKLVAVTSIQTADFAHYIDLQARIDADNISYVAPPNGMGGVVTELNVVKGQAVKKGQLLLKMDDELLRTQMKQIETQIAFAKDIYNRQKNLWDQQIGTEVQLLSAKNNVEALEKQMATLKKQISLFTVAAPVAGIADEVNIKVGETFTGFGATGPQIRIVNTNTLKVVADVPENYLGRVKVGTTLVVEVPDAGTSYTTSIKMASQVINPNTRAFNIEAAIPGSTGVRPNQVAVVRIRDYFVPGAISVPVNVIQTDENGKYVYVMEKNAAGNDVAIKKPITVGEAYGDKIEVKSGLTAGMQLITAGYQSVYDRQVITTAAK
ncbi:MAG: efflux RND transporter periplasmic adaptor subunit [Bacteroidetes bacterium]|nr:efflux RND transporter periplasmic adaptor subunit [Bacteroidota bacterium]